MTDSFKASCTVGTQESSSSSLSLGTLRFGIGVCLAGLAASILWVAAEGRAATDVLVNNYDDFRTGANLNGTDPERVECQA